MCRLTDLHTFQGKNVLKAANAVNVRHILCEKHSKATEALQKIKVGLISSVAIVDLLSQQEGQSFSKVAQEYSEDKAKCMSHFYKLICSLSTLPP